MPRCLTLGRAQDEQREHGQGNMMGLRMEWEIPENSAQRKRTMENHSVPC